MKHQIAAAGILSLALTACGGGSDNSASSSGPAYRFVTPTAGAKNAFSETLVDNLNNTINRTLVGNVSAVNPDGSFVEKLSDPSNNTLVSGSVNHTFYPTITNYNASAQAIQSVTALPNGNFTTCIFSPHSGGTPSSVTTGQSWTTTYTETCGAGVPVTYTQSGTYLGTESIAVSAGTFTAYKFQSTITWTTTGGTTVNESITHWRNAAGTDSRTLKEIISFSYSGTPVPQGTTISVTRELQSFQ